MYKKIFNRKNIYIISFIFLIILEGIYFSVLNKKSKNVVQDYANIQLKRITIEALRNTGLNEINNLIKKEELYIITKNEKGEINSIDLNTSLLNETLIVVSKNVRSKLKEIEMGKNLPEEMYKNILDNKMKDGIIYMVPLGIATGNSFFTYLGPKIPVKIEYSGNVGIDVMTNIKPYGINNALLEAYIHVEVTQKAILPFSSKEIKVISNIPIIIKVINGTVPYYVPNINSTYSLPSN